MPRPTHPAGHDEFVAASLPVLVVEPELLFSRPLPPGSEVLAQVGETVDAGTVVAFEPTRDRLHVIRLEVDEDGVVGTVIKSVGEECRRGETVCYHHYLFGLGWKEYVSPADGVVDSLDPGGGYLVVREHPRAIRALLPGRVAEVLPDRAVTVRTGGVRLKGLAGSGGPSGGRLLPLPGAVFPPGDVAGRVLAVPGRVDYRFLLDSVLRRAAGVVCETAGRADLARLEAYLSGLTVEELRARAWHAKSSAEPAPALRDAGAESDGQPVGSPDEDVSLPVVLISGYAGAPAMSLEARFWERLRSWEGCHVTLDGRMNVDGEPRRPEAVVALDPARLEIELEAGPVAGAGRERPAVVLAAEGLRVRIVGGPHRGLSGVIDHLPEDPVELPGGRRTRVAGVRLGNVSGEATVMVALANLEAVT